jgi:hypothetical protein
MLKFLEKVRPRVSPCNCPLHFMQRPRAYFVFVQLREVMRPAVAPNLRSSISCNVKELMMGQCLSLCLAEPSVVGDRCRQAIVPPWLQRSPGF